ncbi:TetR/AcrR family transcriptional regulator [Longispora fulva]|uniref:AcrR family transcriptional regulator n=1 Tax=Longispora fulva TaxID=619741 RepID=A0A8J7KIL8_9ACTN|nr:TetR/AcrR family transcriptional regulator [Longispora fulva]MBG6134256.1 AcrR family transcriptional regulator [Longispora fulva]
MVQERRRLTADDWADAALAVLAEHGLAAVAVEPLAHRLRATKGSFYWHFPNRPALVAAALARWEHRYTESVIEGLRAEPDPAARLRALFRSATPVAEYHRVEVNVLAAATDPQVAPVLARVAARRLGYLVHLFAELGFTPARAHQRGLLAYATYVGHAELSTRLPRTFPGDAADVESYIDEVLAVLLRP